MTDQPTAVAGRNGVAIPTGTEAAADRPSGYRSYEVHQRQRVGESTEKVRPSALARDAFRADPYPTLELLREHYPCYRDWLGNRYWLTRYDDVTSVFVDDANFETRPQAWYLGLTDTGENLRDALPVLQAEAHAMDKHVQPVAERLAAALAGRGDLARAFAAQLPLELLARAYGIEAPDRARFFELYWTAQRGVSWQPALRRDGLSALAALVEFFEPLVENRRREPGENVVSAIAAIELDDRPTDARDVAATLLETDHETLHGGLANLWYLLLTHPDEFEKARADRRHMKLAWLETLRHSPPVLSADRFTRHEVERFGRLLPEGALVVCSAAAANRDPRVFENPDRFVVDRPDLCQREPRGQYRADGLASGIAFGLGKPSKHPALPEDRPRSRYAIARDTAVTASIVLLETAGVPSLEPDCQPALTSLTLGEMRTCWRLLVRFA